MMTGFERYTRKTRRAIFLEEMEQVVPWRELCALVEPHYPKPGNGRPPVGVERMLRIYFLQQWFNLSDPAVPQTGADSFLNQGSLKFCHCTDDLKHQATGRGAQVQIVTQADERHPQRCEFRERVDQVLKGPPEAVNFPDQDRVKASAASVCHEAIQRRAGFFGT